MQYLPCYPSYLLTSVSRPCYRFSNSIVQTFCPLINAPKQCSLACRGVSAEFAGCWDLVDRRTTKEHHFRFNAVVSYNLRQTHVLHTTIGMSSASSRFLHLFLWRWSELESRWADKGSEESKTGGLRKLGLQVTFRGKSVTPGQSELAGLAALV